MQIFLFKNKFKKEPGDPDYLLKTAEFTKVGCAWDKIDKKGEIYQSIVLNIEKE
jgi:uncharacterized protein (DUF736 family)